MYAEFQNRSSYSQAEGYCKRVTALQSTSYTYGAPDTNFALYNPVQIEINIFSIRLPTTRAQNPSKRPLGAFLGASKKLQPEPLTSTSESKLEMQKQDWVGGAFESLPTDTAPGCGILAPGDGENLIRSGTRITFIYSGAELPPPRK